MTPRGGQQTPTWFKGDDRAKYTINSVKNVIILKEKRGADASFERDLLKAWQHYEGWEYARDALRECGSAKPQ